jgi:uncharacterized protein involved in exopolysaccharide biosynthesis
MLAQQLSAWQMSQKSGEPREDTLEKQLADSQARLVAMEGHYTASHPDVVKLREDIAALKRRIEGNAARASDRTAQGQEPAGGTEPADIQRLRFQIHQTEILIRERTSDQARLKGQLGVYQARLSMSPAVEQKYKELTRDYQTALQFYNELLAKKSQSEMATSLERRQQGEQFRVMDPPDLPGRPSFPNRPLFAGGGLGVGLALGIGITLLLEFQDKSLRTEDDVEHFLGLPTLAMVPLINDRKGDKKHAARPADTEKAKRGQSVHA